MKLYILGNGFDVLHGLCTRYSDFRNYLLRDSPNLLKQLGEFYDIDVDSDLWKKFETSLGQMDVSMIEKQFSEPNYASDEFSDGDYEINALLVDNEINYVKDLKNSFIKWINSVRFDCIMFPKLKFDKSAMFINFNYTLTLENVYKINPKNILHIHGQVGKEIIFGHAVDSNRWQMERMYGSGYEDIDSSMWPEIAKDYAIEQGYAALARKLDALSKKPEKNIDKCQQYISNLKYVDEIVILGATLSNGDEMYIRHLHQQLGNGVHEWRIYYYEEHEKSVLKNIILNCGVDEQKIVMLTSKGLEGRI